jgi:hypothetical protein
MISRPKSPKIKRKVRNISIAKKQSSDYELIATSYHESAHAIVALANLVCVDDVSITINEGGDTNYCLFEADLAIDENVKNIVLMSELKTIYAGLVGEKMYYRDICGNRKFPMHLKIGSSIDMCAASKIIRKYKLAPSGKLTMKLKEDIRIEVERFLIRHWESVKLIAHTLYKKKKLNFFELKYILSRSKDKEFWKDKFKKIKIIYEDEEELTEKVVKSVINSK